MASVVLRALALAFVVGSAFAVPRQKRSEVQPSAPGKPETGADSDPHVILNTLNWGDEYVCYDLYGNADEIYQLFVDFMNKIYVNGEILPKARRTGAKNTGTYLGRIGLKYLTTEVIFTPDEIDMDGTKYPWHVGAEYTSGDVLVRVTEQTRLLISIGDNDDIWFLILRHALSSRNPYLGFYFADTDGLSEECGGLLGEFLTLTAAVDTSYEEAEANNIPGKLSRIDIPLEEDVAVHARRRPNMATKENVKCWLVGNSGQGFLMFDIVEYIVPSLVSTKRQGKQIT